MAENLTYVRTEMLQPQSPPVSQVGAVKWARENLFSGPLNTILTLASLYVVYWLLAHIGPWFANTVWNAGSLNECRAILDGTSGACFAVIKDRWAQLLYGFYPSHLYWRVNLALVLMFVAIAPILFDKLPRKMLWFSVAYPAIGFLLIWGGSIWWPLIVMAGFGVGYAAFVGM